MTEPAGSGVGLLARFGPVRGGETPWFVPDEIEACILDPALIQTHAQALEVLQAIQLEIGNIEAQLSDYALEAARHQEMPQGRREWHRRAAFALSVRQGMRRAVNARDRELRGIPDAVPPGAAENQARHSRLRAEAQDRKAGRLLEHAKVQESLAVAELNQSLARHFVEVAAERLAGDVFDALAVEAKRRRQAEVAPPLTSEATA